MTAESRKTSKDSARQAAAAAKAESVAKQKKRDRQITLIGVGVIVVIVAAVVGAVLFANGQSGKVALPATVTKPQLGFPVGKLNASKPAVQLFEDFQCPICKDFNDAGYALALESAAVAGQIQLKLQPMIFLDQGPNMDGNSSLRATNAWGCAIDQGAGVRYDRVVFKNQPKEGVGYTDIQLVAFGQEAGLTGSAFTNFAKCVPTTKYQPWANNAEDYASSQGVNGTPTVLVNGKPIDYSLYKTPSAFLAAVLKAGAK
jgi:protein-disulfide isomerase